MKSTERVLTITIQADGSVRIESKKLSDLEVVGLLRLAQVIYEGKFVGTTTDLPMEPS